MFPAGLKTRIEYSVYGRKNYSSVCVDRHRSANISIKEDTLSWFNPVQSEPRTRDILKTGPVVAFRYPRLGPGIS